ncbi:hypothetical protein [Moorena sp. SIO3H5]|nr:hypothetical protein [Moorena sp. SIO3H5]NEO71596.1 hypothetical protein [Moorena sp. SIO3H5]
MVRWATRSQRRLAVAHRLCERSIATVEFGFSYNNVFVGFCPKQSVD